MVPALLYGLCMLTALTCAWLLLRAYQRTHYRLLFWCGLFFSIAALNSMVLVLDKLVFTNLELATLRYAMALIGLSVLLPALILERE